AWARTVRSGGQRRGGPFADASASGSDEHSPAGLAAAPMAFPHGLRALNHRDYRRFYFSQFAAQIGSWMQNVAQAWLVLQLTDSPFKLGFLATLQFSPVLLLSIVSGAVADRLPTRPLVVATQTTPACEVLLVSLLV